MDFQLYARVLWRFKVLVLVGFLLALTLAALSVVQVSSDGVKYRQAQFWSSKTRLGVTQIGFPWGRLFAEQSTPGVTQTQTADIPIANPGRFNELAVLYAELATSDPVLRRVHANPLIGEEVNAVPLSAGGSGTMLPLIELTAISTSPDRAVQLARRSSNALSAYLRDQQVANKVPASDRVVIEEVLKAKKAEIFRARSKTMPIVIFLAVMFATIGLAFLLENLRPRKRDPGELDETESGPPQRRSA